MDGVIKFFQKLGKSLMLPVSALPICGLLMGLGYFLCPSAMQGGEIEGLVANIGFFLVKAGGALIDNMALLFAIGVGVGMSEKNDGTGAVAALVSWLTITVLLSTNTVTVLIPSISEDAGKVLAFSKTANPFIGILSGIIGSSCYNRFKGTKLPNWLSFFSGKRCVSIIAGLVSVMVSFILLFLWPVIFGGLTALGEGIASCGAVGAGIYAFLNRLLIPTGLHHALNNVFWFDTTGLGDLTNFWAGKTSADVSWSLGMYMSGFFPCMMFGIPGAAWAMVRNANEKKRRAVLGIMISCAVCSFVCGVTEPFEFAFMFLSPMLYVIYAFMYGVITFITVILGFRAGFCFSGGILDLVFSSSLPAAQKTWLIIPLGLLSFLMFFCIFKVLMKKWKIEIPVRDEDPEMNKSGFAEDKGKNSDQYALKARQILKGLGGRANIISIDNCITRLRLELKDNSIIDEKLIRSAGALGMIKPGKNMLQVIIGADVGFVADEMKRLYESGEEKKHIRITHNDRIFGDGSCSIKDNMFTFRIKDPAGIHARPAGVIASAAKKYKCDIKISIGEKTVSAKSMTDIMSLGASKGSVLTITAEGKESEEALKELFKYMRDSL